MSPNRCVRCDGILLYGEALHNSTYNGEPMLWCRDCCEEYAAASWPDDKWGPYPFTVYPRARPVRCDA
jgi:hypothetical protein